MEINQPDTPEISREDTLRQWEDALTQRELALRGEDLARQYQLPRELVTDLLQCGAQGEKMVAAVSEAVTTALTRERARAAARAVPPVSAPVAVQRDRAQSDAERRNKRGGRPACV